MVRNIHKLITMEIPLHPVKVPLFVASVQGCREEGMYQFSVSNSVCLRQAGESNRNSRSPAP